MALFAVKFDRTGEPKSGSLPVFEKIFEGNVHRGKMSFISNTQRMQDGAFMIFITYSWKPPIIPEPPSLVNISCFAEGTTAPPKMQDTMEYAGLTFAVPSMDIEHRFGALAFRLRGVPTRIECAWTHDRESVPAGNNNNYGM
jgi:hypothetical protein